MQPKMTVTNRSTERRPLWTEPEGADYWMLPEQTFTIMAESDDPNGVFEICDDGTGIQVFGSYVMGYLTVFHSGQLLECGHQRPPEQLLLPPSANFQRCMAASNEPANAPVVEQARQ